MDDCCDCRTVQNITMKQKYLQGNQKNILFGIVLIYYIVAVFISYQKHSQWIFDSFATIGLLVLLYFITKKFYIGVPEFLLLNLWLLLHSFGNFGAYAWSYGFVGYDNIEHFIFPFALAYTIFNYITHRFKVIDFKKHEHRAVFILFILATVTFIGVLHEFVEFSGYEFLPRGDGVFFTGVGDGVGGADIYEDTMTDLLSNMLGSIAGTVTYYFISKNRKIKDK